MKSSKQQTDARGGRWRLGALAALALGVAVVAVVAVLGFVRRGSTIEVGPLEPETATIMPGVDLLGGLGPSPCYVVETSEGLVLIDSGLAADARKVKVEMTRLGLDVRRIKAILLTHTHGDHVGGAERLRTEVGAKVYAGAGDAATLRAGGPREAFFSTFAMPGDAPHPTTVDVELKGGETLRFGDTAFEVLALPGHTPGSIGYLLERDGLRLLFSGDVIMNPAGDAVLGTYAAYLAPRYRGDARDYLATLRKLRAMPAPDVVLTGHVLNTPVSPRMTPARWQEVLDAGIREMQRLIARFEADGPDFLDGHPKELLPDLYYLGDLGSRAVYALFAGPRLLLFSAPGGDELVDFVADRLRQLGREPVAPTAVLLLSDGPAATAGLTRLVEATGAQVVVSPDGLDEIRARLPEGARVLSTDDLPAQGWFDVMPIPLRGRGRGPAAYRLDWHGKTVLLTGPIPILTSEAQSQRLLTELAGSRPRTLEFLASVKKVAEPAPDLWLPSEPVDGQDANLYDSTWKDLIDANYRVGYFQLGRAESSKSAP